MSGRSLDIPMPAVFLPLLRPSRYKGIYGGRGAAKSHEFADLGVERCIMRRGTRMVCIREYQASIEQSVKRLLNDKINTYNLGREFRVLDTRIETPGGGVIVFQGMQTHTAESIKSLEGFDVAWVEEAQTLSQRSLDLLRPTIRKHESELWFSWNPSDPSDPVDDFFRGNAPRKTGTTWAAPPDAILVRATWRDNPFLPAELRREMEWDRSRDTDKYAHVWEGDYERYSDARVFKNWTVREFDTPIDAVHYLGGDWGYSVDPSVLVRCHVGGRTLFVDHEAYEVGCEVDDLPALFATVPGAHEWEIVADSARPETISYLQRHGFPRMRAAVKGPNSVKEGVIFLQNFDIVVHPRCANTIRELGVYRYKIDKKTDRVTPLLGDRENHVIDSLRYATEALRAPVDDGWIVHAPMRR